MAGARARAVLRAPFKEQPEVASLRRWGKRGGMTNPGCILMEPVRQRAQGIPDQGSEAASLRTWEESFSQLQTWIHRAAWWNSPGKEGLALACGLYQLGLDPTPNSGLGSFPSLSFCFG